tara:strand:+ start:279 stop:854 length:576 start_codon:yes stop_codon:yes gene_type:complete
MSEENEKLKSDSAKKIEIPTLKYFWSSSVLSSKRVKNIPRFLKSIDIFKNFTDNQLRILTKYMHFREYLEEEIIVKKNEKGIGFYLIYRGQVKVIDNENERVAGSFLEEGDYFGELALLQENNIRSATLKANSKVSLLSFYQPDLEDLILSHPKVSARIIQALSMIVSNRLNSAIDEIVTLRNKLNEKGDR